jgi:gas vesicle structural protein
MARAPRTRIRKPASETIAERILDTGETSLLDVVDNALNKGVVLSGDLTLALAQVDLVYARLSLLLCAADRVLPNEQTELVDRRRLGTCRRAASASRRGRGA